MVDVSSDTVLATGATATRTLANWFSDSSNVIAFGATGNGTTNDLAAINSAQANASSSNGVVFYPQGSYNFAGTASNYEANQPLNISFNASFPDVAPLGTVGFYSGISLGVWKMMSVQAGTECIMQVEGIAEPTPNANPAYEKNGLQVNVFQQDDSLTNSHDLVALYAGAGVTNSVTQGRVWGANFVAYETSGAVGSLIGLEIDIEPLTAQTALNTTTSKAGLSIVNLGHVSATTGINLSGSNLSSTSGFYIGTVFGAADKFGAALWGGYATSGKWTSWVDSVGSGGLSALQIGGTLPSGTTPIFPSQTNGVLSVTSAASAAMATFSNTNSSTGCLITLTGNGSITPSKSIQVLNGSFFLKNSANTADILTLSDTGNLNVAASITALSATFTPSSTNIFQVNGPATSPSAGFVALFTGEANNGTVGIESNNGLLLFLSNSGGGSNPYKYINVSSSGSIEVLNSAYSTVIFTLKDSGSVILASGASLQIGSAFTSGAPTATGYINITDSSGTIRKVLCT